VRFVTLPNPFSASTDIRFILSKPDKVTLEIFDLNGRALTRLARNKSFPAGEHLIQWSGKDDRGKKVAPGIYFVRLQTKGGSTTAKIVLR
jgi:flagellar hook assembly protein FlgD